MLGSLGLTVTHTRTDSSIHSIPVVRKGLVPEMAERERLVRLWEAHEYLAVEHLSRMCTEQHIRSSIEEWLDSSQQRFYLLFVDMSCTAATKVT
mmetsp:Transcript_18601/g.31763  ORF Transcript_18601/g.31763 Transcript_18601/m.31763 type:complete len:94 (-) Transcript_18601:31-312(-)